MSQPNNKIEIDKFAPYHQIDENWRKLFSQLCYEVFYKSPHGNQLLAMLENKYFRSPVAIPGQDISWSFINEGRNELIRSFTMGIQAYLNMSDAKAKAQKKLEEAVPSKGRPRKPSIRPV